VGDVLPALESLIEAELGAAAVAIGMELEAQAVLVRAKAASEAQQIQRSTLSDLYVQFLAVDKWDGKLPSVTGGSGAVPFINIPVASPAPR